MSEWKPTAWLPFYVADYLGDTQHLSTEQHGAYLLLLYASWNRGGSLPDDDRVLQVITKLERKAWRAHRATIAEFFIIADGIWVQKRLVKELQKAMSTTHRRSEAGARGASRRWQGNGKRDGPAVANAMANAMADDMANGSQIDTNSELRTQTMNNQNHNGAVRGLVGSDERSQWAARLKGYQKGGVWQPNHWGPRPENRGCLVPKDMLDEWRAQHGIDLTKA